MNRTKPHASLWGLTLMMATLWPVSALRAQTASSSNPAAGTAVQAPRPSTEPALASAPKSAAGTAQPEYSLQLHAHFFLHDTGTFDQNEATESGGWNVFFRSQAMLIIVVISGPVFPIRKPASLDVLVTRNTQTVEHKWMSLRDAFIAEGTSISVPFLVYDANGCEDLNIRATLNIAGKKTVLRETVPLNCGE